MKDEFKDRGFDLRRFLMLLSRRLWMLLVGAVIGAALFGAFRFMKEKVYAPEQVYRNDSEYLIEFTKGQEEETQAYFNDYTWNDVLKTDAIAGTASQLLDGIDKAYIANAVSVPTMSDIHIIHVYVEDTDPEKADQIQTAMELSLGFFPAYYDGMESITSLNRGKAVPVTEASTIFRWAAAGAVIGCIIAALILAYHYIMDDRIMIAEDIRTSGARCLGVLFKGREDEKEEERLKEALNSFFKGKKEIRMIDPAGTAVSSAAADKIKAMLPEDISFNTGNKDAALLVCVAAGSLSISELKRFMADKDTAVVFCEAGYKLHRLYYFYGNVKEKKA